MHDVAQLQTHLRQVRFATRPDDPGKSLRVRRRWYADQTATAGGQSDTAATTQPAQTPPPAAAAQAGTPAQTDAAGKDDKSGERSPVIPRERFDEVNTRLKTAEAELEKIRKAQADAEQAKAQAEAAEAVKRGEFEKLYTDAAAKLEALTQERDALKRYQDLFAKQVATRLEKVRPEIRVLLERMTPIEQAEYLEQHGETLLAPTSPGLDGGKRGGGPARPTKPNRIGGF